MFEHQKYPKKFDPYLITDADLARIMGSDVYVPAVIYTKIIPILRQAWLEPGCPRVTGIKHYFDDAWALCTGWCGDEFAGHIGTAFAPFVCEKPDDRSTADLRNIYRLHTKDFTNTINVRCGCVHPVKSQNYWYWRVEVYPSDS
jgi:hypothetical protein